MNKIENEHQLEVARRRIASWEESLKILQESPPKSLDQEWKLLEAIAGVEETIRQLREQVKEYVGE